MKKYVLGFWFINDHEPKIVLIRKNKPDFQKNKLNGVGGKVEDNESYKDAMQREFREEAGVDTNDWHNFASFTDNKLYHVECFYHSSLSTDPLPSTQTDEEIIILRYKDLLFSEEVMPNIVFLLECLYFVCGKSIHANKLKKIEMIDKYEC